MDGINSVKSKKSKESKIFKNQIKTRELNNLYLRLKLIIEMRAV